MKLERRDITPTVQLIKALQSQDWEAKGAISEFVDNSFGEARGNAGRVLIRWNQRTRELSILDNGQGMKDVGDLFQLGLTVGRSPRDIGKYGVGGTMGLVWLGEQADVWTKSKGQMSSAHVIWSELTARTDPTDWHIEQQGWQTASLANTPSELLDETHGTLISLSVPRSKRFHANTIKTELAKRYAPGLRAGRRLRWETVSARGAIASEELASPWFLPDPVHINFALALGDRDLFVQGSIGLDPTLGPDESKIAIGFGHRIVMSTSDCYTSPDGARSYSGLGVAGYIDLQDGWQDYLTTAKTDFTDAELYDHLMAALFQQLEPLLAKADKGSETLQLETLALKISVSLEGALDVDVEVAPRSPAVESHWPEPHAPTGAGPTEPINPKREPVAGEQQGEGSTGKGKGGTKLWLEFVDNKALHGRLWFVDLRNDSDLRVQLNVDSPAIKLGRSRKSPEQDYLIGEAVAAAVAAELIELPEERLKKIVRPGLFEALMALDKPSHKLALLAGHLLLNMSVGKKAA